MALSIEAATCSPGTACSPERRCHFPSRTQSRNNPSLRSIAQRRMPVDGMQPTSEQAELLCLSTHRRRLHSQPRPQIMAIIMPSRVRGITRLARSRWFRTVSKQNRDMMCQCSFLVMRPSATKSSCRQATCKVAHHKDRKASSNTCMPLHVGLHLVLCCYEE